MGNNYTLSDIRVEMEVLKNTFDIVRLVEPIMRVECSVCGATVDYDEYNCYSVWTKVERCENCISAKSLQEKKNYTKFEFVDKDIYFVIARYLVVDDLELVLELVTKVKDGRNQPVLIEL